jgi:succinylarginine dihydrolase
VRTYLFNSQLVTLPDGKRLLDQPAECEAEPRVWTCLQALAAGDSAIDALRVMDVTQSMRNGGGPACLRLRVPLTDAERAALAPGVLLDHTLYLKLGAWIDRHYRDRLTAHDLADPLLLEENRSALDELTQLLGLGALYDFQLENEK